MTLRYRTCRRTLLLEWLIADKNSLAEPPKHEQDTSPGRHSHDAQLPALPAAEVAGSAGAPCMALYTVLVHLGR